MRIRARLTVWFAVVLLAGLTAMGCVCYYEFVVEHRTTSASPASQSAGNEEPTEDPAIDLAEILLWCGAPALALALGGGWWLMRKALEPVAALTVAAEGITEHKLHTRLARTGNGDELDRLTEVFNGMTERLEASFKKLREFTLHASHELKTPLTVMHGELEDWLEDESLPEAQRQRGESCLDEVQRLARMVDGLTLLAKAGAGQVPLAHEPVRLDELLREAVADAQSLADPAGVSVALGPCEPATVIGDRDRLRQVLLNLCDNAVKYNERGGSIAIELRPQDGFAEIKIANTGRGIPPDSLPRIYEPFFRANASHAAVEGCGLGLSIVHWIITAHRGTIEARSEPGKLTTFTLRIPRSQQG